MKKKSLAVKLQNRSKSIKMFDFNYINLQLDFKKEIVVLQ